MLNTFKNNQDLLKRIPLRKKGSKPDVVDLTEIVDGVRDIKLKHHFPGLKVRACKIRLTENRFGKILLPDAEEARNFQTCFAEPGARDINTFEVEGWEKSNIFDFFHKVGIQLEGNAKLHKRLKRALLVACYAGTSDITLKINEDDALPVPFIDGCFLIRLEAMQECLRQAGIRKRLTPYDTVQASITMPEGLAKGTAILMPELSHDVVVQRCNIKTEVKFPNTKPLLAFEGFQKARTPCTDMQTMINCMAPKVLMYAFEHHLMQLADIANSNEKTDEWFQKHFDRHDWWKTAVKQHIEKGRDLPDVRPPLSIAAEAGMKTVSQSPVLKETVYKYACRTMDVRDLKARMPAGEAVAGYLIPDVSRISPTGHLQDSPNALKMGEIRAPMTQEHYVHEGEVLVTRNPNAWGEAITRTVVHHPMYSSRTGVQLSLDDSNGNALSIWGGADMDDSLTLWQNPTMIKAFINSEEERYQHDIPRIDLEKYIDSDVQDGSGFDLSQSGQMKLAMREIPMHLGQVVNFLMNLRLCRQYEWYKRAAACEDGVDQYGKPVRAVDQLRTVYDWYNQACRIWADIFCPVLEVLEEEDGYDPYARVPMEDGEYIPYIQCQTSLGMAVSQISDTICNMLQVESDTNLLHETATLTTKDGVEWCRSIAELEPARIRACILAWGWKALTGYYAPPPLNPQFHKYIQGLDLLELRTSTDFNKKKKVWGELAGRLLTGDMEKDRQIVAFLGGIQLGWGRNYCRLEKKVRWKFGLDSIMWNPSFKDGKMLENGVPEIWAAIIRDFQAQPAAE
jgi:hypothetical protein